MKKLKWVAPLGSTILPGLGQIIQKRYLTGIVLLAIFYLLTQVASLIHNTPKLSWWITINPLIIIFATVVKNYWTIGFIIYIIAISIYWVAVIMECHWWQKNTTH
ncbi:MAG: hypothetical protein ACP5FK_08525 [bacterium]